MRTQGSTVGAIRASTRPDYYSKLRAIEEVGIVVGLLQNGPKWKKTI
jgi:hypothetical protein